MLLIVDNCCVYVRVLVYVYVFIVMFEYCWKYVGVIFENLIFNNVWYKEVEWRNKFWKFLKVYEGVILLGNWRMGYMRYIYIRMKWFFELNIIWRIDVGKVLLMYYRKVVLLIRLVSFWVW